MGTEGNEDKQEAVGSRCSDHDAERPGKTWLGRISMRSLTLCIWFGETVLRGGSAWLL